MGQIKDDRIRTRQAQRQQTGPYNQYKSLLGIYQREDDEAIGRKGGKYNEIDLGERSELNKSADVDVTEKHQEQTTGPHFQKVHFLMTHHVMQHGGKERQGTDDLYGCSQKRIAADRNERIGK